MSEAGEPATDAFGQNNDTRGRGRRVTGLAELVNGLGRFNATLLVVCRWLVILIVAALAVILSVAVFRRYALNNAIPWSEEAAKYLMVWLAFMGSPIALRHGGHVNVDLAVAWMRGRARQVVFLVAHLIVIAAVAVLVWQGFLFAKQGVRQVASSFQMSMVWVYAAVPLGAGLMLLVSLEQALRALNGIFDPLRGYVDDHESAIDEIRE